MRSVISPATPVSTTPGPPTSTPKPSPGNATTSTPSASWPAPGSTSSGAAGRTTPSTTRPTTARCKGSSIKINNRWQLDTGQLTDLFIPVQAVDQRHSRGDGGATAAALPDRHPMGMPGSQHHMDPGIQLGGHLLGAPLGFDVELAQRLDRHLGARGAAPGADGRAAVHRDTAAPQLGPYLRGRHPQLFADHPGGPAVVPVVPHRLFGLVGR